MSRRVSEAVLHTVRSYVLLFPPAVAAVYAFAYASRVHWGFGITAALAVFVVVLPFGHALAGVIASFFPDFDPEDRKLRHHVKSLTDIELRLEETNAITRLTGHTPKWGEERCAQCGVRSPARCPHFLAAERHLYALRTERRYRDEHARRIVKLAAQAGPTRPENPETTGDPISPTVLPRPTVLPPPTVLPHPAESTDPVDLSFPADLTDRTGPPTPIRPPDPLGPSHPGDPEAAS